MKFSIQQFLSELKKMEVTYEFIGNADHEILGFSDPGSYHKDTAIWLGATKYLKLSEGMQYQDVALLFCTKDMEGAEQFPNRILCDDPRNTFMELVELMAEEETVPRIETTAVISKNARLGKGVSVDHFAVIEEDVEIGDNTYIGTHVTIRKGTRIGSNCMIGDGSIIGNSGFGFRKLADGSHKRLPHLGRVLIGNNVEIGTLCTIDRGTFKDTIIDDGVKVDSQSFIAHNVEIGRDSLIIASTLGGNCRLGERVEAIGMRCKNRLEIGSGAKIGIGSVLLTDLPKDTTCFGNPARVVKK